MERLVATVIRLETVGSTNTEAAARAVAGAPEGLCVLANEQTAGRGRLQRSWSSPKGAGLYFSLVLRPSLKQSAWPLITLMAAVAVKRALHAICNLETDIKWPNDVMVNERKLCGILAETVETKTGPAVVLGIGLNLKPSALPPELHAVATSVEEAKGVSCEREVLFVKLLGTLSDLYLLLQSANGEAMLVGEWSRASSYAKDKRIIVTNNNETVAGVTCGLNSDGGLCLRTDDGELIVVRAGDVSVRNREPAALDTED